LFTNRNKFKKAKESVMRNVINKDLALIMLVIIVMLGSGTFHDAFGLEESEKVSATDENMDFLLKYERYMADRYGLHSDGTGLT
jgi:hypothetical protein